MGGQQKNQSSKGGSIAAVIHRLLERRSRYKGCGEKTWADTVSIHGSTLCATDPVAKDTGRWQAAKNLAPMPDVRAGPVGWTTEKSVTKRREHCQGNALNF
ncbi:hypothetical protein [Ruminococcus sp.]|uniref:hypothetical protein n=1 Tax=Ruminococcus sp. TaxID=41978 RepID=UPI002E77F06E|nr:hypothetical protein [Ruminococcus sp.]MEE1397286.1 hypothetical protein [Ruminococcus sp.]